MTGKSKYKKLAEKIELRGLGIPGLKATLIKRTKRKAIYLRSDEYYEVFRIQTQEAGIIFGRKYPARETYPGNDDFGHAAICTKNLKQAERFYKDI